MWVIAILFWLLIGIAGWVLCYTLRILARLSRLSFDVFYTLHPERKEFHFPEFKHVVKGMLFTIILGPFSFYFAKRIHTEESKSEEREHDKLSQMDN